jgi:UDP-N-acetylmuramyl pentapeptide phosphotransferase/UDP-N-acetylglucosamine-1-phosphate transferase
MIKEISLTPMVAFGFSLVIVLTIIGTFKWHSIYTGESKEGVQKIHSKNIPRIGGLAIYLATIAAYVFEANDKNLILLSIIYTGTLVFFVGLAEDLTKKIPVFTRFIVTIAAGVIGWAVTGIKITHLGVDILDIYLQRNQVIAILLTGIAVGGISNSINIIDGLNGLASSMLIFSHLAIASIAYASGDINLAIACLTIAAALLGFFIVNWPWGKIFLGDGGAYYLGFSLAWCCVMLVERNPLISPCSALLICIYPFTETMFSIYRRITRKKKITGPDIQHMHTLVYRRLINKRKNKITQNSIAGIMVGMFSIPPAIISYYTYESNILSIIFCIIFIIIYVIFYKKIIRFRMKMQ